MVHEEQSVPTSAEIKNSNLSPSSPILSKMKKTDSFKKWISGLKPEVSLLALASCNLAMNLLMILFNFYYVNVFLTRYHISTNWLTIAQTFYLVCNFVMGPIIAYVLDYGWEFLRNRRRLVLFAGPAFALVFILPWIPFYDVHDVKEGGKGWAPGVHLMAVLFFWNIFFAIVMSCNNGLFAESTTDTARRVKALTYNQIASSIAVAAVFPVDALSKSVKDFPMFQICTAVCAGVAILCFIFTGKKASDVVAQVGTQRSVNEDEDMMPEEVAIKEDETTVKEEDKALSPSARMEYKKSVSYQSTGSRRHKTRKENLIAYATVCWQILNTRNFWCAIIANLMTFFRVCVLNNFLAVYTEGLISEHYLPPGSIVVAAFYLAAQVGPRIIFVMACPLVRLFGHYLTLQTSLVLTWLNSAIGIFLGTFFSYNALTGTFLMEAILVTFQELFVIFYSEVIDEDVRRHKRKMPASTIIFTMVALFTQPSTALAPMIVVRALNIGGYEDHRTAIKLAPPFTKQTMFLVANCVPACAAFISFVSMCFWKPEKPKKKDPSAITRL